MWHGKMTKELETLYDSYYEIFGVEPDGYMDVDYGQADYDDYVRDIKMAIKKKMELPEVSE